MTEEEIERRFRMAIERRRAEWPWIGEPQYQWIDQYNARLLVLAAKIGDDVYYSADVVVSEEVPHEGLGSPEGLAQTAFLAMERAAKRTRAGAA